MKEEEDRRRAKELEELIKKEQERQRQVLETEARRIREEEEARLRLIAFQEAQRIGLNIDDIFIFINKTLVFGHFEYYNA